MQCRLHTHRQLHASMQEFLVYSPTEHGSVQDFCNGDLAPSKVFPAGGPTITHWLSVNNLVETSGHSNHAQAVSLGLQKKAQFEARPASEMTKKENKDMAERLLVDIQQCAVDLKCAVGKWMLRADESRIDHKWLKVAEGVADGTLGASSCKVGRQYGQRDFLMCVYLGNFDDKAAVGRLLNNLRSLDRVLGPKEIVHFKSDILTDCGISSGYHPGVKISRWSSG